MLLICLKFSLYMTSCFLYSYSLLINRGTVLCGQRNWKVRIIFLFSTQHSLQCIQHRKIQVIQNKMQNRMLFLHNQFTTHLCWNILRLFHAFFKEKHNDILNSFINGKNLSTIIIIIDH
jgi:hypothetical protein